MFPVAEWLRVVRRVVGNAPVSAFDYGDPRGHPALHAALAEYLGRARGVLGGADRVVVTSGSVQALGLLARVSADAGHRVVAMEDPGLPFHREVVRHAGAEVVALPVDGHGARTDLLRTPAFDGVRVVVLTPAHQYPTGVPLHPRRRQAAVEWARACGGLIVEDDYDGEFRYDRQPVGALQGMAPDHVAYVGTAAKTLGPALRLAWVMAPARLLDAVTSAKRLTDLHTETLGQLALAELITTHGYDRHIRACRARYRRRRDLLVSRLAPRAARGFTLHGIAAGLQAMLTLPPGGPGEAELLAHAATHGLALDGLAEHWHAPGDHPQALVLGYGSPTEAAYPAALDTLTRTLRDTGGPGQSRPKV